MGNGRGGENRRKKRERDREQTVLQSPAFTVTVSKVTVNSLSTICRTKLFLPQMPSLVPNTGTTADTLLVGSQAACRSNSPNPWFLAPYAHARKKTGTAAKKPFYKQQDKWQQQQWCLDKLPPSSSVQLSGGMGGCGRMPCSRTPGAI